MLSIWETWYFKQFILLKLVDIAYLVFLCYYIW